MLLADKLLSQLVPIRFLLFVLVGGSGVLVHLAALWLCLNPLQLAWVKPWHRRCDHQQFHNKQLAHLPRLSPYWMEFCARTLILCNDMQLWCNREPGHRSPTIVLSAPQRNRRTLKGPR
jgi:hypothetical protein